MVSDTPRIGERCAFLACPRCSCGSVGTCTGFNLYRDPIFAWEPPRDDCACDCHAPFRMLRGPRPAAKQRVA